MQNVVSIILIPQRIEFSEVVISILIWELKTILSIKQQLVSKRDSLISLTLPVDGGFTQWSSYSDCSTTCGDGIQERLRSCTQPEPQNGGKQCSGQTKQSRKCNLRKCPGELEFVFKIILFLRKGVFLLIQLKFV